MPNDPRWTLTALRLERVYDLAPPRVVQALEAEIAHLLSRTRPRSHVLEIGCGYGRVAMRWAARTRHVMGIDVSPNAIELADQRARAQGSPCRFEVMDAAELRLPDAQFDMVACVQNTLAAAGTMEARRLWASEAFGYCAPADSYCFTVIRMRFGRRGWSGSSAWHVSG